MYDLKIDFDNLAKGAEVAIPGLGTYKNGETAVVTNEEAIAYRTYRNDVGMGDETFVQSFKGQPGIDASLHKDDDKKTDDKKEGDK